MWKQIESIGVGFLLSLPFFFAYWVFKSFVHFGDEIFDWLVEALLGRNIFGIGFLFLIAWFWLAGNLLRVPRLGPLLQRFLKKIPFVGAFIQHREVFSNIRKMWEKTGCGPIFVSLYRDKGLHPAGITEVFLTDYGYLVVIAVASFPPQELYYWGDDEIYYGLPASEVSAIHMSLGFGAKRRDLRGVFKKATLKELVVRYNLYRMTGEETKGASERGQS